MEEWCVDLSDCVNGEKKEGYEAVYGMVGVCPACGSKMGCW